MRYPPCNEKPGNLRSHYCLGLGEVVLKFSCINKNGQLVKEFTLVAVTSLELHLFLTTLNIKGDLLEVNFTESFEENPGPLFKENTKL